MCYRYDSPAQTELERTGRTADQSVRLFDARVRVFYIFTTIYTYVFLYIYNKYTNNYLNLGGKLVSLMLNNTSDIVFKQTMVFKQKRLLLPHYNIKFFGIQGQIISTSRNDNLIQYSIPL